MKSRDRFLNTVLKDDRLKMTVDVWVSALCGSLFDATVLPPLAPPHFTTVKYCISRGCSGSGDLMFPHADFVTDKVLHSGFFVLHRSGFAKCVPWRCNFFV